MSNVTIPTPSQWIAGIIDETAVQRAIEDGAPRYGCIIWYTDIDNVKTAMAVLLDCKPLASQQRQDAEG
jgi:hypothetical protein